MAGVALALVACAPTYAEGYLETFAAAQRAQHAGRWDEAAVQFEAAAKLGDRYKDRDEARFRAAEALERQGKFDDAESTYRKIELESDGRYQGVRAAFALGRLVQERRGFEAGEREMLRAVRTYPKSGLVRHSIRRLLEHVEQEQGVLAARLWIAGVSASLRGTEAEEAATFEHAGILSRAGSHEASSAMYLALARSNPYPQGSLTDDAFFRASLELETLGRPKEAIRVLEEMLAPREAAYAGASYERPRFPEAAFRIAVLERDALKNSNAAIRGFARVADAHSESRFVDDALWEKARLEHATGLLDAACSSLERLESVRPDSRYVRCAALLCAANSKPQPRPCSNYIVDAISGVESTASQD